ncbi:MAG: recX [Clostridiaceae bacterium]|jgi:regulatory protein|nr:recX [Clostridiaceae bacterium]
MKITNIEVQKNNKDRVNIYIDDTYSASCNIEVVYLNNLKKGTNIDVDALASIIEEDEYIRAKNTSLKIIEKSYKAEKEVTDKLKAKGYSEGIIKKVMEFLREYSFVDDEKYVTLYVKEKSKSTSKKKIRYVLINKGINADLVDEKLTYIDNAVEENTAVKLGEKKYKSICSSCADGRKAYNKLGAYLYGCGFTGEVVKEAIKKIFNFDDFKSEPVIDEYNKLDEIKKLAEKRYNVISKSENNVQKLYRKLAEYLLRRGYSFDDIKTVLKDMEI